MRLPLEGTLLEKLRKIEALHAGTKVDGEREAARRAAERSRARLAELQGREREEVFRYSLPEPILRAKVMLKAGEDIVAEAQRDFPLEAALARDGFMIEADPCDVIFEALERSLRPAFEAPPASETEVQRDVEKILRTVGARFHREKERAPLGATSFIPDFTVPELGLAIEAKLARQGHGEAAIQGELAQDAAGYGIRWGQIIVGVYDPFSEARALALARGLLGRPRSGRCSGKRGARGSRASRVLRTTVEALLTASANLPAAAGAREDLMHRATETRPRLAEHLVSMRGASADLAVPEHALSGDALTIGSGRKKMSELKYWNYSMVMRQGDMLSMTWRP